MIATEYQAWLERATQNVEGALGSELSTPTRTVITEDYLRSALLRGLALSYPEGAAQVERELDVNWNDADCIGGHAINGPGRRLQHDVGLHPEPNAANDSGAAVEIKWLTASAASNVAQDIWKLALARSTANEGSALRTYFLIGGSMDVIASTTTGLRNIGLPLRWSPAGRGKVWPRPSILELGSAFDAKVGREALLRLLRRGEHVRTPPACWSKLRASLRWRWYRRVGAFRNSPRVAWRLLLWELDHRSVGANTFDWDEEMEHHNVSCTADL